MYQYKFNTKFRLNPFVLDINRRKERHDIVFIHLVSALYAKNA